ncbi:MULTISPECIES: hypothetical protein [Niastella]|uniref:Outer membrane protein beta-barrel domain-containing protein n=1 Tax=Niastella soli TaxID=2821487 RepID=A0ABS3Z0X2_9BACT|nr:hypothetical protein [Niastella soli]MBO9203819.1 hypothetical protein [Niastella soli]
MRRFFKAAFVVAAFTVNNDANAQERFSISVKGSFFQKPPGDGFKDLAFGGRANTHNMITEIEVGLKYMLM